MSIANSDSAAELERLRALVQQREREIEALNQELADSNRGVVALYAELDENASALRRASDLKSRVISNVSHEFRTPLNSILGLSKLLLDRADGELTPEQEKQVRFIRTATESLSRLVNDMLDLSRVEAGRVALRITHFSVDDLVSSLRGTMRPLVTDGAVELVFEPPHQPFMLETDEGKLSQILRNLISNALKFTERGWVRVRVDAVDGNAVFEVEDTGIGIAPDDREFIFEEFTQIDGPLQRRVKGSGLGLPISRRLASLLGGDLAVRSEVGKGSCFVLRVPCQHIEVREMGELVERARVIDPERAPVLVVEDDRQTLFLYEKYLSGSGFQVLPARSIDEARGQLQRARPAAIVLDVMLESETSWAFLAELKQNEETRDIPLLVVTVTNQAQKARALGADEFWLKPVDRGQLLTKLQKMARTAGPIRRVLVIDDDDVSRYVLRRHLADTRYEVLEAATGPEGVSRARADAPDVIFLDFVLPDMTAFDVLDELKMDPRTRFIPVIVYTGKPLDADERRRLERETTGIVMKQSVSRELALARIRDALVKAGVKLEARDRRGAASSEAGHE